MSDLARIHARKAEIAEERDRLDRELRDLAIAERVLLNLSGAVEQAPADAAPPSDLTRRDKILAVLNGSAEPWLTSTDINKAIARRFGGLIKSSSLLPMLTNLKDEGVIIRKDGKLALKERVQREGGPI